MVVHTMWPRPELLQWHTLHHTVMGDIYSLNIPSPRDMEHSKTVKQLQGKLEAVSPFIRHEAFSDAAGFAISMCIGLFVHYGLGLGIGHVDWSQADWQWSQ